MTEPALRAQAHLANERTFLAWLRTGLLLVLCGFVVGRFSLLAREVAVSRDRTIRADGVSIWLGALTIAAGVGLTLSALMRYRRLKAQLDAGAFEPGEAIVGVVAFASALLGGALAGYLVAAEFGVW
jgi:putative membrane protein